ncbi:MAG: DUF2220 domain-containing protein [Lachnospiraceae bacterium]|nr:DUF2220 domain-containing protein [Lachnospiraceae bacterium]
MNGLKTSLNKRQKDILGRLLDKYERSKTYRDENKLNQSFTVKPQVIFSDYDSDFADLDEQTDFERDIRGITEIGYVEITEKDGIIRTIRLNADSVMEIYRVLERQELKNQEAEQIEFYLSHAGRGEILDRFCQSQIGRLRSQKKAEYDLEIAKNIVRLLEFIANNSDEILERELSIELFGDSKKFEREFRTKIITVLRKYGSFDDLLEDVDDKREQEHILLAEFNIFANPTYVNFKGDGRIILKNGSIIPLCMNVPLSLESDRMDAIEKIEIYSSRIVTVENLTSFNRIEEENTFFIYLAGYHNTAKQRLICKLAEDNPTGEWLHFGDIDPDGFYILEHLKKKTGIPFITYHMGISDLDGFRKYCKKLEENDIRKAHSLLSAGKYCEEMRYMLENNVKLEQEVISWKAFGRE